MPGMPSQHIGGDCSLYVRAATIDFDDGAWECQVTASDFTTQDALTSQPVQLVVRSKYFTWNFISNIRFVLFFTHIGVWITNYYFAWWQCDPQSICFIDEFHQWNLAKNEQSTDWVYFTNLGYCPSEWAALKFCVKIFWISFGLSWTWTMERCEC